MFLVENSNFKKNAYAINAKTIEENLKYEIEKTLKFSFYSKES